MLMAMGADMRAIIRFEHGFAERGALTRRWPRKYSRTRSSYAARRRKISPDIFDYASISIADDTVPPRLLMPRLATAANIEAYYTMRFSGEEVRARAARETKRRYYLVIMPMSQIDTHLSATSESQKSTARRNGYTLMGPEHTALFRFTTRAHAAYHLPSRQRTPREAAMRECRA